MSWCLTYSETIKLIKAGLYSDETGRYGKEYVPICSLWSFRCKYILNVIHRVLGGIHISIVSNYNITIMVTISDSKLASLLYSCVLQGYIYTAM